MSITKLYVRLRESGEVKEVYIIARASEGVYYADVWGIDEVQYIGKDCDLCDEQGRLLKPEDPTQALKDELLDEYRRILDIITMLPRSTWNQYPNKLAELESKLKLNTKTP